MFNITVESITRPIPIKFCPFCGGTQLQKVSYGGASEDNPSSEGIQCENCSLFFTVGDVDAEAFQHLVHMNNGKLFNPIEREKEFLKSFSNGTWDTEKDWILGNEVQGLNDILYSAPTCPTCKEVTYSLPNCPFCGQLLKTPEFKGNL